MIWCCWGESPQISDVTGALKKQQQKRKKNHPIYSVIDVFALTSQKKKKKNSALCLSFPIQDCQRYDSLHWRRCESHDPSENEPKPKRTPECWNRKRGLQNQCRYHHNKVHWLHRVTRLRTGASYFSVNQTNLKMNFYLVRILFFCENTIHLL